MLRGTSLFRYQPSQSTPERLRYECRRRDFIMLIGSVVLKEWRLSVLLPPFDALRPFSGMCS